MAGEHEPQADAERIDVGADVEVALIDLLGAGEMRGAGETSAAGGEGLVPVGETFREAEINDLHHEPLVGCLDEDEVRRLQVAMDQPVLLGETQRLADLPRQMQGVRRRQRPPARERLLERLPVAKLHGVVVRAVGGDAEAEDAGDIRVAQLGGGAGFAEKAVAHLGAAEDTGIDDFEGDIAMQVGVTGLVGHAHRATAQFEDAAVVPVQDFVVFEADAVAHATRVVNQPAPLTPAPSAM